MAQDLPPPAFADLIPPAARHALPGGISRIVPLHGGRGVNQCFRVEGEGGSRVLRLRRGPSLAGTDARRELASQRIAAAAGFAPTVFAADAEAGWMVMAHVPASPWTVERLREPDDVWRLCTRLRALHELVPPPFAPVDSLALLRANCEVIARHAPADARRLVEEGAAVGAQLEKLRRRRGVICHGDPDVGNFLGEAPVFIDFEYAQVADPVYDLALLITYYPFLEAHRDTLLAASGLGDPLSRRRLPLQTALCRLINSAWQQAQTLLTTLD